jgi:GT2 family glycosyltransferase
MGIELSIISGTVDRPAHLAKFVKSVLQHTDIPYELILLDAGINPVELSSIANPGDPVIVIREPKKLGYAKAYNNGFKAAKGKYCVFLNDDCTVTPSWAIEAVRFMDKTPWCGLGAIYFSNYGDDPFHISEWLGLPYANFGIISKELGDKIGWFDECCYTYGADNSLTFKVLLDGKGIAGIPYSKIVHSPINDNNKIVNMTRQPEDARNLLLKYRHRLPEMIEVQRRYPKSAMNVY